jgi:hypothetical protein
MIILIAIMSVIIALSMFAMVVQSVVYYNMPIWSSIIMIVVPIVSFVGIMVLLGYRWEKNDRKIRQ